MENSKTVIIKNTLKSITERINNRKEGESRQTEWQPPEGFIHKKFKVKDIKVEHLAAKDKKSKAVILYLHGGGYVIPNTDLFRYLSLKYSMATGGSDIFSVDYRIAPKNMYPAALEDAIEVYSWLLKEGYSNENIIISGDSAGANLTLALTLYLKDNNIPLPKGVIVLSPWTNPANDFASIKNNYKKDLVLGEYGTETGMNISNSIYFKEADLKNDPYASPYLGDFYDFPSLLIEAGGYEMLLDDAKVLASKAKEAGVNVKFKVYDEMPHDFMIIFGQLEESKDAWREISNFINNL